MKLDREEQLMSKYPAIFRDRYKPEQISMMCYGLSVDEGWYQLIDDLCAELMKISNQCGLVPVACQVKEKFAGLRFYVDINAAKGNYLLTNKRVWMYNLRNWLLDHDWARGIVPMWFFSRILNRFEHMYYLSVNGGPYKRINYLQWYGRIHDIISKAEDLSYKTCEICGKSGSVDHSMGWMKTLCEEHRNKREQEKKEEVE